MSLHDTDALIIESGSAAESLPDPTTVSGRTHILSNTAAVSSVWSSTGATPFTEGGVNVATITVKRGASKRVQSDGTRWIVISDVLAIQAGTAVSDGSGNATWVFPTPFSAAPVVTLGAGPTALTDLIECRITSITATQVVVACRRAPAVTILGISVITFPIAATGLTIQFMAKAAG